MATDLSQNSVLHFLQSNGGSVKNADLLLHFRSFIRDNAERDRHRERFKKFVNTVAIVKQIDGVSYIVLKKQFKGNVPGGGGGGAGSIGPPWVPQSLNLIQGVSADKSRLKQQLEGAGTPAPPGETSRKTVLPVAGIMVNNNNNMETNLNLKTQVQQPNVRPEGPGRGAATQERSQIPDRKEPKTPNLSEPPVHDQCSKGGQEKTDFGPLPGITPGGHHRITGHQVPVPQTLQGQKACLKQEGGLHQEPPLHSEVIPRRIKYRSSYKSAVSYDEDEEEEEEEVPVSSGGSVCTSSSSLKETMRATSNLSPLIMAPSVPPSVLSSSSSSSSERMIPKIWIQDVEEETLTPRGSGRSFESGLEVMSLSGELMSTRRSPSLEAEVYTSSPDSIHQFSGHQDQLYSHPAEVQLEAMQGLHQHLRGPSLSSHSSIFSPSSDAGFSSSDWPSSGSSRASGWNSSFEDLQTKTVDTGREPVIQEALQRAQRSRPDAMQLISSKTTTAPFYHSTGNLFDGQEPTLGLSPLRHSTDNLHNIQESSAKQMPMYHAKDDFFDNCKGPESSEGSTSTPVLRQRSAASAWLSPQVRSRMCRSLGADLDQILQEEGDMVGGVGSDAARLNRLHLISSSLSLRANLSSSSLSSCSTPSRCHSLAELVEATEHKEGRRSLPAAVTATSTTHQEGHGKQSLVPLDHREHTWLVKGAAGAWPDIYSLFREDSSLLNKQDFISGFTVLHWIAKHGDHRVLNTLWYGVQKVGMSFNVNARSTCGHTPLHIAAMHGHKNIMRLLVKNFCANVKQRDISGKRPWQYLSSSTPLEIFEMLGAPARSALKGVGTVDPNWNQQQQQQQQRRRRRHHLSSASSAVRPLTIAGTTKVKRSTSIAAFLKHKSLNPFMGQHSDA